MSITLDGQNTDTSWRCAYFIYRRCVCVCKSAKRKANGKWMANCVARMCVCVCVQFIFQYTSFGYERGYTHGNFAVANCGKLIGNWMCEIPFVLCSFSLHLSPILFLLFDRTSVLKVDNKAKYKCQQFVARVHVYVFAMAIHMHEIVPMKNGNGNWCGEH